MISVAEDVEALRLLESVLVRPKDAVFSTGGRHGDSLTTPSSSLFVFTETGEAGTVNELLVTWARCSTLC